MIQLLLYFFELLHFKVGAERAPYSVPLLALLLALDVIAGGVIQTLMAQPFRLELALAAQISLCLCVSAVLLLRSRTKRLVQTLTAFYGGSFWINFIGIFMALTYDALGQPKKGVIPTFFALGLLGLILWTGALLAHLLRSACDWKWPQALPAAAAIVITVSYLSTLLR
jgi:ABC-type amino acid transport system permease subunit